LLAMLARGQWIASKLAPTTSRFVGRVKPAKHGKGPTPKIGGLHPPYAKRFAHPDL